MNDGLVYNRTTGDVFSCFIRMVAGKKAPTEDRKLNSFIRILNVSERRVYNNHFFRLF